MSEQIPLPDINININFNDPSANEELMAAVRKSLRLLAANNNDQQTYQRELERATRDLLNRVLEDPQEGGKALALSLYAWTLIAGSLLGLIHVKFEEHGDDIDSLDVMQLIENGVEQLIREHRDD